MSEANIHINLEILKEVLIYGAEGGKVYTFDAWQKHMASAKLQGLDWKTTLSGVRRGGTEPPNERYNSTGEFITLPVKLLNDHKPMKLALSRAERFCQKIGCDASSRCLDLKDGEPEVPFPTSLTEAYRAKHSQFQKFKPAYGGGKMDMLVFRFAKALAAREGATAQAVVEYCKNYYYGNGCPKGQAGRLNACLDAREKVQPYIPKVISEDMLARIIKAVEPRSWDFETLEAEGQALTGQHINGFAKWLYSEIGSGKEGFKSLQVLSNLAHVLGRLGMSWTVGLNLGASSGPLYGNALQVEMAEVLWKDTEILLSDWLPAIVNLPEEKLRQFIRTPFFDYLCSIEAKPKKEIYKIIEVMTKVRNIFAFSTSVNLMFNFLWHCCYRAVYSAQEAGVERTESLYGFNPWYGKLRTLLKKGVKEARRRQKEGVDEAVRWVYSDNRTDVIALDDNVVLISLDGVKQENCAGVEMVEAVLEDAWIRGGGLWAAAIFLGPLLEEWFPDHPAFVPIAETMRKESKYYNAAKAQQLARALAILMAAGCLNRVAIWNDQFGRIPGLASGNAGTFFVNSFTSGGTPHMKRDDLFMSKGKIGVKPAFLKSLTTTAGVQMTLERVEPRLQRVLNPGQPGEIIDVDMLGFVLAWSHLEIRGVTLFEGWVTILDPPRRDKSMPFVKTLDDENRSLQHEVPGERGFRIVFDRLAKARALFITGGFTDPEAAAILISVCRDCLTQMTAHLGDWVQYTHDDAVTVVKEIIDAASDVSVDALNEVATLAVVIGIPSLLECILLNTPPNKHSEVEDQYVKAIISMYEDGEITVDQLPQYLSIKHLHDYEFLDEVTAIYPAMGQINFNKKNPKEETISALYDATQRLVGQWADAPNPMELKDSLALDFEAIEYVKRKGTKQYQPNYEARAGRWTYTMHDDEIQAKRLLNGGDDEFWDAEVLNVVESCRSLCRAGLMSIGVCSSLGLNSAKSMFESAQKQGNPQTASQFKAEHAALFELQQTDCLYVATVECYVPSFKASKDLKKFDFGSYVRPYATGFLIRMIGSHPEVADKRTFAFLNWLMRSPDLPRRAEMCQRKNGLEPWWPEVLKCLVGSGAVIPMNVYVTSKPGESPEPRLLSIANAWNARDFGQRAQFGLDNMAQRCFKGVVAVQAIIDMIGSSPKAGRLSNADAKQADKLEKEVRVLQAKLEKRPRKERRAAALLLDIGGHDPDLKSAMTELKLYRERVDKLDKIQRQEATPLKYLGQWPSTIQDAMLTWDDETHSVKSRFMAVGVKSLYGDFSYHAEGNGLVITKESVEMSKSAHMDDDDFTGPWPWGESPEDALISLLAYNLKGSSREVKVLAQEPLIQRLEKLPESVKEALKPSIPTPPPPPPRGKVQFKKKQGFFVHRTQHAPPKGAPPKRTPPSMPPPPIPKTSSWSEGPPPETKPEVRHAAGGGEDYTTKPVRDPTRGIRLRSRLRVEPPKDSEAPKVQKCVRYPGVVPIEELMIFKLECDQECNQPPSAE